MKRYICYGDSNTYGYDPGDFFGMPYSKPWPAAASEMTGDVFINYGQNGREIPHSAYGLQWLLEDLESYQPADGLLIMLGSNDLLSSLKPEAERVTARMEALIQHLQAHSGIKNICLIAPPGLAIESELHNQMIQVVAKEYRQLAMTYHLDFLDAQSWDLTLGHDGVHLTEEAHRVFAEHIADYVNNK